MTTVRIACFVSAHGFGHAARTCAVIEACREQLPASRFAVYTAVPRWFFEQSLGAPPEHHPVAVDLGLVQATSLDEDLAATARELRQWIPLPGALVDELAARLGAWTPQLVICDVAPLGIAVARRCGVPSLLIENFTWDWIYRGYLDRCPPLAAAADYLEEVFAGADYRIQTVPFCQPAAGAKQVAPVSRRPRGDRAAVRRRLGVPAAASLVMVTMGGIEWHHQGLEPRKDGPWLVIPGAGPRPRTAGRMVFLPHRSEFFHPDLVAAADAVVGKLGYSTLAEVYRAGVPFGYVPRPHFPESRQLAAWVEENLPCRRIDEAAFKAGRWRGETSALLALPRRRQPPADGARQVAGLIAKILRAA